MLYKIILYKYLQTCNAFIKKNYYTFLYNILNVSDNIFKKKPV
jgi:hypothetical protein